MFTLALLFSVVIILLLWLVKLLQTHFDSYDHLSALENEILIQNETHVFAKNAAASVDIIKEQVNRIVSDRLIYLNKEISSLPSIERQGEEFELLLLKQQLLLKTYFNLYKKQTEG